MSMLEGLNMNSAQPFPLKTEMFKEQRQRLAKTMREEQKLSADTAAFLQGGSEVPINSSEWTYTFVQEPFFYYLFGTELPDCYGFVLTDGTGLLFIPRLPEANEMWMGELPNPKALQAQTGVDECYYVDEMARILKTKGLKKLEVLKGIITDSDREVLTAKLPFSPDSKDFAYHDAFLFNALSEQRCFKTKYEIDILKYVGLISSNAHIKVMQSCKPGKSQHQLESVFLHEIYHNGGCRRVGYACICPTGKNNATLHYPYNDKPIENDTVALLDMGGCYQGYSADITCSFPVNGKFSEEQKVIYNAVLASHDAVLKAMKPGLSWVDMHYLSIRTICEHLLKAGFLRGTLDELMEKEIMQFFMPHGLGHLVGLDVHDVGGYLPHCPPRPTKKDACKLRTARVLEEGLHITIEPGCYFNHTLLTQALSDPKYKEHLNEELIRKYWDFGGVRIESDVIVTKDGILNCSCVPRTVDEVERTMAGKPFSKDFEILQNA